MTYTIIWLEDKPKPVSHEQIFYLCCFVVKGLLLFPCSRVFSPLSLTVTVESLVKILYVIDNIFGWVVQRKTATLESRQRRTTLALATPGTKIDLQTYMYIVKVPVPSIWFHLY